MQYKRLHQLIKEKYQLDFVSDLLLNREQHVTFFFDLYEKPIVIRFLSGDLSQIGFPIKNELLLEEAISLIEPDNKLAEIEGREIFIQKLKNRIKNIKDSIFLYIPIKSDNPLWLHINFTLMSDKNSHQRFIFGKVNQIFHEVPNEIILYQKTYQDTLTRLFTRETLKMHLNILSNVEGSYGFYLDIDNFKRVNDNYGHHAGDQLLIDIANYFISVWEQNVLYYRLGGDEFFIYVYHHSEEDVFRRAHQIIHDIENLSEETKKLGISVSIGIVPVTHETKEYYNLLNLADQTMYISKSKGPGNVTLKRM